MTSHNHPQDPTGASQPNSTPDPAQTSQPQEDHTTAQTAQPTQPTVPLPSSVPPQGSVPPHASFPQQAPAYAQQAPHQAPPQPPHPAPSAPRASAGKPTTATAAIVAITAAVGGIALFTVGATAAFAELAPTQFSGIESFVRGDSGGGASTDFDAQGTDGAMGADGSYQQTVDVTGVTSLDMDIDVAAFNLQFGDVSQAELAVTGPQAENWVLGVTDTQLTVETPNRGLTTGCLVNCGAANLGGASATLTLPRWLADEPALSVEAEVQGGSLSATGDFAAIEVDGQAAELQLNGSTKSLSLDLEAGKASAKLADVTTAALSVEAGAAQLELTGRAPDRVDVDASTGSAEVRLPSGDYRVDERSELGKVDNRLTVDKASKHVVSVRAEAAQVILR